METWVEKSHYLDVLCSFSLSVVCLSVSVCVAVCLSFIDVIILYT